LKGRVQVYNVPPAVDVGRVREKTGLSQTEFASRYGFNPRSLQDWEQGRRMPDSAARAYLLVIANNPKAVEAAFLQRAS
jgi:putative transcriptional regulator